MFSYSWLWGLLSDFDWFVHWVECPKVSTVNCNLQKGLFCVSSLGMYINLSAKIYYFYVWKNEVKESWKLTRTLKKNYPDTIEKSLNYWNIIINNKIRVKFRIPVEIRNYLYLPWLVARGGDTLSWSSTSLS